MAVIKELTKEEEQEEEEEAVKDVEETSDLENENSSSDEADVEGKEEMSDNVEASADDGDDGSSAEEDAGTASKDFKEPSGGIILPDEIKFHGKRRRKVQFNTGDRDEGSGDGSRGEEPLMSGEEAKKRTKRKPKKDDKLFAKRAVALFMLFPMVAGGLAVFSEAISHFRLDKSMAVYGTAFVAGAAIATYLISKLGLLGSVFKLGMLLVPVVFLLPSYQTYSCSPIPLKNEMLGTYFKLNTNANAFLELTYVNSECFKSLRIHSPYVLSLFQPRIALLVAVDDVIPLSLEDTASNEQAPFSLFMLSSKRSVKGEYHTLHLVVQAPKKIAAVLNEAKKLTATERRGKLLRLTGRVHDMPQQMQAMKAELEGMKHNIRPVVFDCFKGEYVDRYGKHSEHDEGSD